MPRCQECRLIRAFAVTDRTHCHRRDVCRHIHCFWKLEYPKGADMDRKDKVEGEGSYSGTKDYNQRTKKFIDSGKVDEAARDAEPKSEQEKQEIEKAERDGKQRAKK